MAAFRHAGANPVIGTQLGCLLRDAGLTGIDTSESSGISQPTTPLGQLFSPASSRAWRPLSSPPGSLGKRSWHSAPSRNDSLTTCKPTVRSG